jgi:hypothetical protein
VLHEPIAGHALCYDGLHVVSRAVLPFDAACGGGTV